MKTEIFRQVFIKPTDERIFAFLEILAERKILTENVLGWKINLRIFFVNCVEFSNPWFMFKSLTSKYGLGKDGDMERPLVILFAFLSVLSPWSLHHRMFCPPMSRPVMPPSFVTQPVTSCHVMTAQWCNYHQNMLRSHKFRLDWTLFGWVGPVLQFCE